MIVDQKSNMQIVGVYLLDVNPLGMQLAKTKKPNWFQIICTRLFLGWKWVSIQQLRELQKKELEKQSVHIEDKSKNNKK
jgi:hypothetical protein